MNKRIFELSEQAGMNHYSYNGYATFDLEKFAELIVQECAGLVQGVPTDTMGYQSADHKIKQHFGVE